MNLATPKKSRILIATIAVIVIGISLTAFALYVGQAQSTYGVVALNRPITHAPPFLGNYTFILGSGTVLENGTAYSYVRINASAVKTGDSFLGLPALNVGLAGKGVREDNFTVEITYVGSAFASSPYWINFSVTIPLLNMHGNSSQMGIAGTFLRSTFSLSGFNGAELFTQISNVVGENNEFEYFFYIGNSSTPVPQLTHGPVH